MQEFDTVAAVPPAPPAPPAPMADAAAPPAVAADAAPPPAPTERQALALGAEAGEKREGLLIPKAAVKRIMKIDPGVSQVANDARPSGAE